MTARHLVSIADLSDGDVSWVLQRAADLADGAVPARRHFTAALLFLSSSLRTKLGFGTAVTRLGGSPLDLSERRWDPKMSGAESFEDTLRTVTGMTDLTVVRAPVMLGEVIGQCAVGPVICGGDLANHPSQALIDVFAMERLFGSLDTVRLALVGDMQMRGSRSLLQLLSRRPPAELTVVAPPSRDPDVELSPSLGSRTRTASLNGLSDVDVVVMCGLAPNVESDHLSEEAREPFVLTRRRLEQLPAHAVVLSPMPVIDEIAAEARLDPRVRIFQQSDLSVYVRIAALELLLDC